MAPEEKEASEPKEKDRNGHDWCLPPLLLLEAEVRDIFCRGFMRNK